MVETIHKIVRQRQARTHVDIVVYEQLYMYRDVRWVYFSNMILKNEVARSTAFCSMTAAVDYVGRKIFYFVYAPQKNTDFITENRCLLYIVRMSWCSISESVTLRSCLTDDDDDDE